MRIIPVILGTFLTVAAPGVAQGPPGGRGGSPPGIQVEPGQPCPPGTTEIRPHRCQAPVIPPPSLVDYRPRSTLVVPEHPVPRARFPAIDFHGHPRGRVNSAESLEALGRSMDSLNLGMMVVAENLSGERLQRVLDLVRASPTMRDRIRVLAGVDFRNVGPGWAERAVARLEAAIAAGAVGIGEIGKSLGLFTRRADGTRLRVDDPDLDPVWAAAARLGVPVFLHTGDPQEFWQPIDNRNERWLELALFPRRRYPADSFPSFEELMTERDNLLRRNPRTTFVIAHMGWHANDLARLGRMLDEFPNMYTEVGAVLYDLGRQPRAAREFFLRYQDRILFGKDAFETEEYPYYWRVLETADDYFDYYRGYHAFWKLYGLDLPDSVLRKVYAENALGILERGNRE